MGYRALPLRDKWRDFWKDGMPAGLASRYWRRFVREPLGCRTAGRQSAFFQSEIQYPTCDDQGGGNEFRLGGMQTEDIVFCIHPDLLDKEPFDPVHNEVNGKQGS